MSVLPDILTKAAAEGPDKAAIIDGDRTVSYSELDRRSSAVARLLTERCVQKGHRAGVLLPKSTEQVVALWGCLKAGVIFVIIDPRMPSDFVLRRIKDSGMTCLITSEDRKGSCDEWDVGILATDEIERMMSSTSSDSFESVQLAEEDPAGILFTSQSTGPAKGVLHSQGNLAAFSETVVDYLENTPADVIIQALPLSSSYGLSQLLTSVCAGATLVLQKSMLPNDICRTLVDRNVTGFAGVPTTWTHLLQRYSPFRDMDFPALRYVTNAGGALPGPCLEGLQSVLGDTRIYLMYGQTETLRSTYLEPDQVANKGVCLGKPIRNVDVHVFNRNGNECSAGEEGELVHCGAHMFLGYWNDPEATARVLRPLPRTGNGPEGSEQPGVWTGDIVRKDEEGYLYFVGRNDEMIQTAGYRVGPQEIEDVIHGLAPVKDVVVFGVPDRMLGSSIRAVVVFEDGSDILSTDELMTCCRERLPPYMVPSGIEVADDFPKTAAGKIARQEVKRKHACNG